MRILIMLISLLTSGYAAAAAYEFSFSDPATRVSYYAPNTSAGLYESGPLEFTSYGRPSSSFAYSSNARISMRDDSLFGVTSISLGEYSHVFNGQQLEITFAGRKADDSIVYQSFALDGVMAGSGDTATTLFEDFRFSSDFSGLTDFYMMNIAESQWDNAVRHTGSGWDYYRYRAPHNNYLVWDTPGDMPGHFSENPFAVESVTLTYVPIPAAAWLFGSALVGLGWVRRRKPA